MNGKYTSPSKYLMVKLYRSLIRSVIRPLVRWQPLRTPREGYTLILGCNAELADMLLGNLACVAGQQLENLQAILVVFDRPRDGDMADLERRVAARFASLPVRFLYYTPRQARVTRMLRWGWVNAWLSWCIGLSVTQTRFAMLHDFDAMLLGPRFIEDRYRAIRQGGAEYLGIDYYQGNGVERGDELVKTIEMFCDVRFVRERFRPLDLFNHVTMHNGRSVDFDTFLLAQATAGRRGVVPASKEDMVHPSQMICDFAWHRTGNPRLREATTSLMMIPYFVFIGGEAELMQEMTQRLMNSGNGRVEFFGRPLSVAALTPEHVDWLKEQAWRLDKALCGAVRDEVRTYFDALGQAHQRPQATALALGAPSQ